MNHPTPEIIDCECGLRYMRQSIATPTATSGAFMCPCGEVVGEWDGLYQLVFKSEEGSPGDLN
jgi:hypothetical protein